MHTRIHILLSVALVMGVSLTASAWDWEVWEDHPIQIHGSFSQGFLYTGHDNWLEFDTEGGSLELNDMVLNARVDLSDSWSFGLQILSRDFGETGNNKLELDWAYFDYNFRDWLGVRLGRVKIPFGLYAELWDLDIARNTVFLPAIYPVNFRDVFTHIDGINTYGTIGLGKLGSLNYSLAFGDLDLDKDSAVRFLVEGSGAMRAPNNWGIDYMAAGKLEWLPPVEGLRLAASYWHMESAQSNINLLVNPAAPWMKMTYRFDQVVGWIFSAEYTRGNWVLAAEFARYDLITSIPEMLNIRGHAPDGRWYVQADYRWNDWLATTLGVGSNYSDWTNRFHPNDRTTVRHDAYVATRFDITDYWMVKAEVHYLDGQSGLSLRHNMNEWGADDRSQNHWMFAMKTALYF